MSTLIKVVIGLAAMVVLAYLVVLLAFGAFGGTTDTTIIDPTPAPMTPQSP